MSAERSGSHGRKKSTLIISGYTCIGKTTFSRLKGSLDDHGFSEVVDMDSSGYSRDGRFPENYLADIRQKADGDEPRVLLIATFPGVATRLKEEGYYVAQVYPEKSPVTKQEWLRRLENREGKDSRLYKLVDQKWDEWFDEMVTRDVSCSIEVSSEQYLSSVIEKVYAEFRKEQGDTKAAESNLES